MGIRITEGFQRRRKIILKSTARKWIDWIEIQDKKLKYSTIFLSLDVVQSAGCNLEARALERDEDIVPHPGLILSIAKWTSVFECLNALLLYLTATRPNWRSSCTTTMEISSTHQWSATRMERTCEVVFARVLPLIHLPTKDYSASALMRTWTQSQAHWVRVKSWEHA